MIWTFDRAAHTLSHDGPIGWSCEAHGEAVPMPEGPLPAGTFTLGAPLCNDPESEIVWCLQAEGPYFIPVENVPGHTGIGIHGGGSAALHPLAARQGWYPTENCIRVQNVDLYHIALNVTTGDTLIVK